MNHEQKAKELIDKFWLKATFVRPRDAIVCAIVAVDEILNCKNDHDGYIACDRYYWKFVREELEKQLVKS